MWYMYPSLKRKRPKWARSFLRDDGFWLLRKRQLIQPSQSKYHRISGAYPAHYTRRMWWSIRRVNNG